MSPEQVKGDKSIDHRSDIYALGVTLFYAIEGRSPYDTENESQFDIFNKIVYEELPILSSNSKHATLIKQACQKDRNLRFQQIEDFENALNVESESQPKVDLTLNKENKKIEKKIETTQRSIQDPAQGISERNQKSNFFIFLSYMSLILLLSFSVAYLISLEWYLEFYWEDLEFGDNGLYQAMQLENLLIGIETTSYVFLSSLLWLFLYRKFKMKIHFILRIIKIIFSCVVGVWAFLKAMHLLNYSTTQEEIFIWIPFIMFELFFTILLIVKCRKKAI
jgi:serine/threonine protein kinase